MRKVAAVPVALALADQLPAIVVAPEDDVRKVAGSVIVHRRPVGSAAAQLTGSVPLKIFRTPDPPMVVCRVATCAVRRAVLYW